jgi:hypothetical protein
MILFLNAYQGGGRGLGRFVNGDIDVHVEWLEEVAGNSCYSRNRQQKDGVSDFHNRIF